MGFLGIGDNMADKWQAWSISVAKNPEKDSEFRINPKGNTDIAVFNEKLAELSDDLIKQYDKNGDKKISYEEYEEFELKQVKENAKDIDEESLKPVKEQAKLIFNYLNVDNEGDSKDGLDRRELMNMFHTMDGSNDFLLDLKNISDPKNEKMFLDGLVSEKEYLDFVNALSINPRKLEVVQKAINDIPVTMKDELPEEQKAMADAMFKTVKIQQFLKKNYEAIFKDYK